MPLIIISENDTSMKILVKVVLVFLFGLFIIRLIVILNKNETYQNKL